MKLFQILYALLGILALSLADANELLYVVGNESREDWGIYWILPNTSPTSPVKLIGGLDRPNEVQRYGDKVYWNGRDEGDLWRAGLLGEDAEKLPIPASGDRIRQFVVHGNRVYWTVWGALGFTELDGETDTIVAEGVFFHLAIRDGRLYSNDRLRNHIVSMRFDGSDYREELTDVRTENLAFSGKLLLASTYNDAEEATQISVRDVDTSQTAEDIDSVPRWGMDGLAATPSTIYWTGRSRLWRYRLDTGERERVLLDPRVSIRSIDVVSLVPQTMRFNARRDLVATVQAGQRYQLVHSEDLFVWRPYLISQTVFAPGSLKIWLRPQIPSFDGVDNMRWRFDPVGRSGFYSLFQYHPEEKLDVDQDGLPDSWERSYFNDLEEDAGSDPDGDGLSNALEYRSLANPSNNDTDGDGLDDLQELEGATVTDVREPDSDDDGLSDGDEVLEHRTNPDSRDSDKDGHGDGFEIMRGTNPLDSASVPARGAVLEHYAPQLLVHYDFGNVAGTEIANKGTLGDSARISGEEYEIIQAEDSGLGHAAIELQNRIAPETATYIDTQLSLGDLGLLREDAEFTLSMWYRFPDNTFSKILASSGNGFGVSLREGLDSVAGQFGHGWVHDPLQSPSTDWKHLAFTVTREAACLYHNGRQNVCNELTVFELREFSRDSPLLLGVELHQTLIGAELHQTRPPSGMMGLLSDVRIYSKALPREVVKFLAEKP